MATYVKRAEDATIYSWWTRDKVYEVLAEDADQYLIRDDEEDEMWWPKSQFDEVSMEPKTTSRETQVGGNHYTKLAIQPYEYINANKIGFNEGNAIKYLTRWRDKGGIQDLEKAIHSIQWLIDYEKGKQ